jgi:nucleoside-diphosphate kinase
MAREETFVMLKPDSVQGGVIDEIIARIKQTGLNIAIQRCHWVSLEEAGELYSAHRGRPFYSRLVDFTTSFPAVLMVVEGDDAVRRMRALMGATNPAEAEEGTIRRDFALPNRPVHENCIHGSDSTESAKREISIFFEKDRQGNWKPKRGI